MTGTVEQDGDAIAKDGDARIITSGAERMRRSRGRRRQGEAITSLGVGPSVIAALITLGWLPGPDHDDKDALAQALIELIERAIELRVTPTMASEEGKVCFMCELKPSTIETLIHLGWIRADQQHDLAAIVTGFRRFAGRSLEIARNNP
jgi:hypothetical protein